MTELDIEWLRKQLHYDAETGIFKWNVSASNKVVRAGQEAGSFDRHGYRRVRLGDFTYPCHRLAWFYVFGSWPLDTIDHINGDRSDNRLSNLRDVSAKTNAQNIRTPRPNNQTGLLGVTQNKKTGRFVARIVIDGRQRHLGTRATAQEAHQLYVTTKRLVHEGCTI